MGTDYGSGSAVIVNLDSMLGIINGKNKKAVLEVVQSFVDKHMDDEYTSKQNKKYLGILNNLPSNIKLADLRELLSDFHVIEGEAGKYGGNCRWANGFDDYEMLELWEGIIEVSYQELPHLNEVRFFDGYRQHMDCPMEEPCFCFDPDGCYEKTLNSAGKNLYKLSGSVWETSWTDVSY